MTAMAGAPATRTPASEIARMSLAELEREAERLEGHLEGMGDTVLTDEEWDVLMDDLITVVARVKRLRGEA